MMRLFAVAAAVLVCVFAYLLATGLAMPEAAGVRTMFVVSSVALVLSTASAILALAMSVRLRAQRIEIRNLARSVDAAFTDLARRERVAARETTTRDGAGINHHTSIETETPPPQQKSDLRPIEIANVAPYPVVPHTDAEAAGARQPTDSEDDGTAEFQLRPIRSTVTGVTAGFDLAIDENGHADGSESATGLQLSSISAAAAERRLVMGAIAASGRPDFAGDRTPLHVAVSEALLADRTELTNVVEALRRLNGTARSLILSLPTQLMENPAHHAAALARLAATRSRLAARGWPASEAGVEALWRSGVSFLRSSSARLVGGGTDHQANTISLLELLAASGITVIATDVRSEGTDEDLAALGVMLMTAAITQDMPHPQFANGSGKPTHM